MICPACATDADPLAASGAVVICAGCGKDWVVDAETSALRPATAAETTLLSDDELMRLRRAAYTLRAHRGKVRR